MNLYLARYLKRSFLYLRFDPETGALACRFLMTKPPIIGWYTKLEGQYVFIYRIRDRLFFGTSKQNYPLDNSARTSWTADGRRANFEFWSNNKLVYKVNYKRPSYKFLNITVFKWDMTYDESLEDLLREIHAIVQKPDSWQDCFAHGATLVWGDSWKHAK